MTGFWRLWVLPFLASILVFLGAFFGVEEKILTPRPSERHDDLQSDFRRDDPHDIRAKITKIEGHCQELMKRPPFDKLVFIVIDAFRADFMPDIDGRLKSRIPSSSMPFLEGLLRSQHAVNFVSLAQTPTVTMPRLKAILAGIKPNFLDVVFNLNASHFGEDNIIEQAKNKQKRMIFYGDDTWLHMFPRSYFLRANETFSFFATDYTQVDTNVTENLLPELDKLIEWDMMFLHYLGVDHIGHSFDAYSDLLGPKLTQMDKVVQIIFQKVAQDPHKYLIVVTGDHGMTDDGNHGGSSDPESETSLILISSKPNTTYSSQNHQLTYVKQIDIAVTLSLLLGIKIPAGSNGRIISSVFDRWVDQDMRLCSYFYNTIQIRKLLKNCNYLNYTYITAFDLHLSLLAKENVLPDDVFPYYQSFLENSQSSLLSSEERGTYLGILAQFIALAIECVILYKLIRIDQRSSISIIRSMDVKELHMLLVIALTISSIIFLGSTDFIESEHLFWNYTSIVLIVANLVRVITINRGTRSTNSDTISILSLPVDYALKLLSGLLAIMCTILTSYWQAIRAYLIDNWMAKKEYCHYGASVAIISFVGTSLMSSKTRFNRQQCIVSSGLLFIYLYRCDMNSYTIFRLPFFSLLPRLPSVFKARIVYLHIFMLMVENLLRRRQVNFRWGFIEDLIPQRAHRISDISSAVLRSFVLGWVVLISLLVKSSNIPLVALNLLLEKAIFSTTKWSLTRDNILYFIVVYVFFGTQSFYSQGNSNGVSTIDITPGYVGLVSYDPIFSALLVSCHTYGLFVFWILMMFLRVSETKTSLWFVKSSHAFESISKYLLIANFMRVIYFQIVAFILRNHLFIWSVISPKLLYEAFQCLVVFAITNIVIICDRLT